MSNQRNESRRKNTASIPEPNSAPQVGGDILNFTVPTEIIDLPSGGKMYPVGHPAYGKDAIEIRHMTTKEEDILSSQSLLRKGIAIDRMMNNIIMDEGVQVEDLIIGDRNALMYAARISGYGPEYGVFVDCDECEKEFEHQFDLSNYTDGYKKMEEGEDYRFTDNGTVEFTLPMSKVVVQIRALTGEDEKRLEKVREMKEKNNLPEAGLTDMLKMMLFSANGVEDKSQLNKFIDKIPARDSKSMRDLYRKVMPNVVIKEEVDCSHCGHTMEMEVPILGDFFWPG